MHYSKKMGVFCVAFSEYLNFKGKIIEDKSAVFASRGIASLALAFFGVDGLPTNYDKYVISKAQDISFFPLYNCTFVQQCQV